MALDHGASQVRAEQTRLLMEGTRSSIPTSLAVAGLLSYIQWPLIQHSVVAAWFGAIVLVSLLRWVVALLYFRTREQSSTVVNWLPGFNAGVAVAGAVWGLGAWVLFPSDDVAHQAFLGMSIAGLAAGAVASLSASLSAALGFLSLLLIPLAARFLLSDQSVTFSLGLLTILFLGVTAAGARRINASIVQNVSLRLQSSAQAAALRESEKRTRKLSMVAARTDNAVIVTDGAGRVEWVNDGFTHITGYTLPEVLGRTPGSVLQGPETDERVVQRMRENLRRGQGFDEEVLNYTKDGRPYWISIEVQPVKNDAGETVEFMAIERDISESRAHQLQLEQAMTEAEKASRTKSDFLAMMSHEIRTPLNGILGSLALLQDSVLDTEQRKHADTSCRSAEWLLTVANNMLNFSTIKAGKIELEPNVFSISGLIDSVVEMLEPQASEKTIGMFAEVDAAVPRAAEGDSTKIRQVLLNLASNSVKFTSAGEVRIRVSLLERSENLMHLRFMVSDTGEGIPWEQQGRVFEEYWTRSQSINYGSIGTGLGLSIARRLVNILGGEIDFESRPGEGSRFWFDVPLTTLSPDTDLLEEPSFNDYRSEADAGLGLHLEGHVLIAEDNPANQMIAQSLLERLGLKVDVVANGLEAVEAVRNRPYDLVLMDIGMPKMDGVAATRAIRALEGPSSSVPIVAVTAHIIRSERETLMTQGLNDYLPKPLDRTALLNCLTRWLSRVPVKVAASDRIETSTQRKDPEAPIDESILDQLLEDVGPENAEVVVNAFIQELAQQTIVLKEAADKLDLNSMARTAHRLKSSAASCGAIQLSQVVASIEHAAQLGPPEAALESMGKFLELAQASRESMEALSREVFGSGV